MYICENKQCFEIFVKKITFCFQIRDLRHDNLNPFIGACLDAPSILIVTSYCSKGSLQDVLENDDILLDEMFRASLVFDIIRVSVF